LNIPPLFDTGNTPESSAPVPRLLQPVPIKLVILLSLILIIATCSLYWQVGAHEFINLDDNAYITSNAHVRGGLTMPNIRWAFTSVDEANWHPLTWLSHLIDVQLYGMNPRGHHLTNVALHTATAVLLLLLLTRITAAPWRSFWVAALFALHPLHVESVAWAAERKDVLSGLFWFLTLFVYCEYVRTRRFSLYLLALLYFLLGLMAKPMLVTLPLIMLVMDFWPLQRFPNRSRFFLLAEKLPFLLCTAMSSLITFYAQRSGGAVANLVQLPLLLRCENALLAFFKYIGKLFWPIDLAVMYPFSPSIPLWQIVLSLTALILLTAAFYAGRRRFPYLIFGWTWFVITLIPVIGVVQVGSQSMADRYTYIPSVGLFVSVAWGMVALAGRSGWRNICIVLVAGMTLAAAGSATYGQIGYWQNNFTLYGHALQATRNNFFVHNLLGTSFQAVNNTTSALWHYRESIRIFPSFKNSHNNLGVMLVRSGKLPEARQEFTEALILDPTYTYARVNLAIVNLKEGDWVGAEQQLRQVLRVEPYNESARFSLGQVFEKRGDFSNAIKEYQEALRINPYYEKAQKQLQETVAQHGTPPQ
jgi:hypothetical protein